MKKDEKARKAMRYDPPLIPFNLIVDLCGGDCHNLDKELNTSLGEVVDTVWDQAYAAATARAVEVLDVQVRDDGVWLHFKASTGKSALLCVESLAEGKRGIIGMALREWCADRHVAIKALGGGDE